MSRGIVVLPAALCLIACLLIPMLFFHGQITSEAYKSALLIASLGWFLCAAILAGRSKG